MVARYVVGHERPRTSRRHPSLPVRPGRRADPDRGGAQSRLARSVRPRAGRARPSAVHRRRLPAVRRRQARAATGCATSWPRADVALPEGSADDPPEADTVAGVGNRKNDLLLERLDRDGVEVYPGSVAYLRAVRGAGLPDGGRHRLGQRGTGDSRPPASTTSSTCASTAWWPSVRDCRASRRRTRSSPAARLLGVEPAAAAVFEDALAGVAAGRAGGFGFVVGRGPRRPGRGAARATAPTSSSPTSPTCWTRRDEPGRGADEVVPDRAVAAADGAARPVGPGRRRSRCSPSRTATSACAAPSRRASRASFRAPTSAASSRSGRCPTPRPATASPSPARPSSTSPTASSSGCIVGDSPFDLRYGQVRSPRAGPGPARRHPASAAPSGRSPNGSSVRVTLAAAGVVHPASARGDLLRGRAARRRVLRRPPVRPARQRAAPSRPSHDPRDRGAASPGPLQGELHDSRDHRAVLVHRTARSRLRVAAGMDHLLDAPRRRRDRRMECRRGPGPADRRPAARLPRAAAAAGQAARLRLVEPAVRLRPAGPGRRRARRRRSLPGWDALAAQQREFLDRFWERSDVEIEGDPALQQAVRVVDVPRAAGRRAHRVAGHPGQGPDRPRLRRPRLLGHRDLRAADADLHRPGGRQGRAELAAPHAARGHGPGRRSWA